MASYTYDFCKYVLSGDTSTSYFGTAAKLIPFDEVESGFTEISKITVDLVTTLGRINFAADAVDTWDFFRIKWGASGQSNLVGNSSIYGLIRDDNAEGVAVDYWRSNQGSGQCEVTTGWIPVQNSLYMEPMLHSSDSAFGIQAETVSYYSGLQIEAIKAL